MSKNTARRLGMGSYAVLIGAIAVAMVTIGWALAPQLWSLPWYFGDVFRLVVSLGVILFGVAVILGAIALVRGTALLSRGGHEREVDIDALEIARRRYARGEIGQEEFRRLRDDLQSS